MERFCVSWIIRRRSLVTGKNSGAGIGLTIAQELVSGNGGLIEFESRPGKTVFRIRLPVAGPGGKES